MNAVLDPGPMLTGIFQVSILHNIVHLLYGIAGVALSRTGTTARHFLLWGRNVYLADRVIVLSGAPTSVTENIIVNLPRPGPWLLGRGAVRGREMPPST